MKLSIIVLALAILFVLILSGCTQPEQPTATCGNSVVEGTEQCDGTAGSCGAEKICMPDCTCGIPTPPALPE